MLPSFLPSRHDFVSRIEYNENPVLVLCKLGGLGLSVAIPGKSIVSSN